MSSRSPSLSGGHQVDGSPPARSQVEGEQNNSYFFGWFSIIAPDPYIQFKGALDMFEIIILFIISESFRSIHWQGAEIDYYQGPCKMYYFGRKMIFMDLGCLGPLVVDLGCVFCCVAALPRNFIRLWSVCMWLIELVLAVSPCSRVILLVAGGEIQHEGVPT